MKMDEIYAGIKQFIEHFRDQATELSQVKPLVYRKILYATALDPIARAAFGKADGNRARILKLINELTEWNDRDRVSLPQLSLTLNEQGSSSVLSEYVESELQKWSAGVILRLDNSPCFSELENLAAPKEMKNLNACRYSSLFYTYRNNLIHEFREPGYGMEMASDQGKPYYHSMMDNPWQLVFPVGFFERLYEESLVGLEAFLTKNYIDPYNQFEFGSIWRSR